MRAEFLGLIFMWLLPLMACRTVTSGHNHDFTHMMTEEMPNDQLLMQEAFTSSPPAEVSGYQQHIDTTLKEERTTTTPMNHSLQTTPPPTTPTAATLTYPTSSQLNSLIVDPMSTTEVLRVTTPNMVPTSPASSSPTAAPRLGMSSMPSGDVTFKVTSDEVTNSFTYSTGYTNFAFITTKSEASTSPVTVQATDRPNTSQKATKKRKVPINIPKKKEFPPPKSSQKEANTGKIVAGIIGGALVLMVVCFLVIYIKKWKLHKQQITTNDWAGPSPFINSGDDKGRVTLQSPNRISLSSFLPQRMSRRLSLLPEADEELENINLGTTFGDHQEVSFNREVAGADGHKSNGNAAAMAEKKNPADTPDIVENSVPTPTS